MCINSSYFIKVAHKIHHPHYKLGTQKLLKISLMQNAATPWQSRDVAMPLLLLQIADNLHTQENLETCDSLGEAPQKTISMCEEGPCTGKNWLTNCNMCINLYIIYNQNFINQLLNNEELLHNTHNLLLINIKPHNYHCHYCITKEIYSQ